MNQLIKWIHTICFFLCLFILSACTNGVTSNLTNGSANDGTESTIPSSTSPSNISQYIRQQWALDLQIEDVARIELFGNDTECPYAEFTGDALLPLVEMINSMNGQFIPEPIVAGSTDDFLLSTIYVFMNDDTRYTIQKIAGKECNYVSIDNSVFMCTDELFDRFPETGTGSKPMNHVIAGNRPIEIPKDQISKIRNVAPESEALPVPKGYETYDWMVNLKAEDVEYIEFVNLDEIQYPYRRYQGDEIQEVIDLFQNNQCYEYVFEAQWHGYFSKEFHIVMKDGTAHTVCSIYSTKTVIDGAAYNTISDWLNDEWPEIGNEPLPENWGHSVASRNYYVVEDEVSVLSTSNYEAQKKTLDYEYDTNLLIGSISRNYFIGRGVIELSAQNVSSTGLTLNAYWTGFPGNTQLMTKPEYWLEQWHDDDGDGLGEYVLLDTDCLISLSEQTLIPEASVQWDVHWDTVLGSLEAGNYRIGMTIVEKQDGLTVNEMGCYAKFLVQ